RIDGGKVKSTPSDLFLEGSAPVLRQRERLREGRRQSRPPERWISPQLQAFLAKEVQKVLAAKFEFLEPKLQALQAKKRFPAKKRISAMTWLVGDLPRFGEIIEA
ncbi:hypothetical protein U1Q18_041469, partial [Sarracenia purpurea var. burkii]